MLLNEVKLPQKNGAVANVWIIWGINEADVAAFPRHERQQDVLDIFVKPGTHYVKAGRRVGAVSSAAQRHVAVSGTSVVLPVSKTTAGANATRPADSQRLTSVPRSSSPRCGSGLGLVPLAILGSRRGGRNRPAPLPIPGGTANLSSTKIINRILRQDRLATIQGAVNTHP